MALRAVVSGARSSLLLGISGAALGTTVAACADDTSKMFDPEALERGAKALREIQASPYAKRVSAAADGHHRRRCRLAGNSQRWQQRAQLGPRRPCCCRSLSK